MNIPKNTVIDENTSDTLRAVRAVYSGEPCSNREGHGLLAIGRKGEVRWLVDPRAKRTAASVWKSWIPYSRKARIAWFILRWSLKLGVIRFMPGVSLIEVPSRMLGRWAEHPPELKTCAPVIFIGKPSSTQKLTIFLGNERSRVAAVAKLALTDKAIESIDNEATTLRQLHGVVPGVPQLISSGLENGLSIEEWVEGKSIGRDLTRHHLSLLLALPRSGNNVCLRDNFHAMIQSLSPEHQRIAERFAPEEIWNGELPEVWEHGDFTPWNLKKARSGDLLLFDWEYATPHGLPLLDLLHFFYRQEYLFRDIGDVRRTLEGNDLVNEYCRMFCLNREVREQIERYYLLRSLRFEIPSLGPSDTYELFVTRQLENLG